MRNFQGLLVGILLTSGIATAQNESDALRYSMTELTGTARSTAMGGAFGALGGDMTSLSVNPAGIGVFRNSAFVFTPTLAAQISQTNHLGFVETDSDVNFNFGNIGYVNTWEPGGSEKWKSLSFGIAYNRTGHFHSNVQVSGINNNNSFLDVWTNSLNENETAPENISDPFGAELAWYLFLLDTAGSGYYNPVGNLGINQEGVIESSGSMGETVVSFGGNFSHKLYLGATLGITNIRYSKAFTLTETSIASDTTTDLDYFRFKEELETVGTGYNLKLGFIYRIKDNFRVGGAFHTPTSIFLRDDWETSMVANFRSGYNDGVSSPIGTYNYRLKTPMKAIASLAYVFKKKGLISVDYEFVDYGSAELKPDDDSYTFSTENETIGLAYKSTGNLKVGAEYRLENMTVRGGFINHGNPFEEAFNNNRNRKTYSAGLGFGDESMFLDFSYFINVSSENIWLYQPGFAPTTNQELVTHNLACSIGFRF